MDKVHGDWAGPSLLAGSSSGVLQIIIKQFVKKNNARIKDKRTWIFDMDRTLEAGTYCGALY